MSGLWGGGSVHWSICVWGGVGALVFCGGGGGGRHRQDSGQKKEAANYGKSLLNQVSRLTKPSTLQRFT